MYLLTLSWNNHSPPEGSLYLRISLEHNKRKTISNWWAPTCQAFPTHFILFDFPPPSSPLFANLSPLTTWLEINLSRERGPTEQAPALLPPPPWHAETCRTFHASWELAIWPSTYRGTKLDSRGTFHLFFHFWFPNCWHADALTGKIVVSNLSLNDGNISYTTF